MRDAFDDAVDALRRLFTDHPWLEPSVRDHATELVDQIVEERFRGNGELSADDWARQLKVRHGALELEQSLVLPETAGDQTSRRGNN